MSAEVKEIVTEMIEFSWIYCNVRYFVTTREHNEEGLDLLRNTWHQVDADVNAEAHILDLYFS